MLIELTIDQNILNVFLKNLLKYIYSTSIIIEEMNTKSGLNKKYIEIQILFFPLILNIKTHNFVERWIKDNDLTIGARLKLLLIPPTILLEILVIKVWRLKVGGEGGGADFYGCTNNPNEREDKKKTKTLLMVDTTFCLNCSRTNFISGLCITWKRCRTQFGLCDNVNNSEFW